MNSVTSSAATPFLSPQSWRTSPSPTRFRFVPALSGRRPLAPKPVGKRWRPPKLAARLQAFRFVEPFRGSKCGGEGVEAAQVPEAASESLGRVIQFVVKPLACAVFFIAVGFAPFRRVQAPAVAAAAVATELNLEKMEEGSELKGHEYSNYTKRLLEKVSVVLRRMDEIRRGEGRVKELDVAMKAVTLEKRQLQDEIMRGMYEELRELRREKEG